MSIYLYLTMMPHVHESGKDSIFLDQLFLDTLNNIRSPNYEIHNFSRGLIVVCSLSGLSLCQFVSNNQQFFQNFLTD